MMAKMDKKTNWTKIKIYIGQKTNNFFFLKKMGQLCAKNGLILGPIPKISQKYKF
jgi:hypothetical protein